ncbi:putative short-chain dehydrogenases/reductase [Glonium stellatum]|uniref:Putative short-chain dehydrogenases/reductase n=1 Tax=Glonium stellatum TaxID=574774 RepID=A0A8E2JYR5_9PEZI|nr:putative short-chain dehydrogenases/reductase [Glonium stellatum]
MASYVIAGASRGLGYEFLRQLSSDPSNKVVGLVRNKEAVQAQLSADNITNVHLAVADLTDPEALVAAAKATAELTDGVVDYLIVNGAYISADTRPLSPTNFIGKEALFKDDLTKAFMTNVAGPLYAINAFLPLIRAGSTKKVTIISSGMADTEIMDVAGVSQAVVYSASKSAANVLAKKYAIELKSEGIIFLALSPGLVNTSGNSAENMTPEMLADFQAMLQRFREYEPGFKGPITPEESVKMQLKVIRGLTLAGSGEFLSHHGNKRWL